MRITKIVLQNVQAISDLEVEWDYTSNLIQFAGGNSNGKSILFKILYDCLSREVYNQEVRDSLIRDGEIGATLTLHRDDGLILTCVVARERSSTFVKIYNPFKDTQVIRNANDSGWFDVWSFFGFHYDRDLDYSLNIQLADKDLLFYNTNEKLNGSALESSITHPKAVIAEANISEISKVLSEKLTRSKKELDFLKEQTDKIVTQSKDKLDSDIETIAPLLEILKSASSIDLDIDDLFDIFIFNDIKQIGKLIDFDLGMERLSAVLPVRIDELKESVLCLAKSLVKPLEYTNLDINFYRDMLSIDMGTFDDAEQTLKDLIEVANKVCPACGRSFIGHKENRMEVD